MLRSVLRPATRRRLSLQRTFVSTVLLSRTWEAETVVDLRKEARLRGLSTKGNKPALIARLQEYEESKVAPSPQNPSPPSRDVPGASRKASSRAAPTSDPATPALPQGASPAGTPPSASAEFFAFKMPDLSQPYSFIIGASCESNSTFTEPDPEPTKLYVVGGTVIDHGSGPTLHLEKHSKVGTVQRATTIADDVIELFADLSIPTTIRLRPIVDTTVIESRETTGVYALLGTLVGSWPSTDESPIGEQH
ncbi:hypothetical protein F5141DRAFT_1130065 [Pisolithus sp. B1]|nr:hypothetical protein F5141DRAFT_1130065 [Pisolithus sp. B1]